MSKLVVETREFRKVLRVMARVLPRRTDLAAQGVFHITSGVGSGVGVVWGGSDQERLMMKFRQEGELLWQGAVPAVELCRIVRAAPGKQVEISDDPAGRGFRISSGGAGWVISPFQGQGFVGWQGLVGGGAGFEFGPLHRGALSEVRYAIGSEDARPALSQVRVSEFDVSASDGQKAHHVRLVNSSPEGSVFFPQHSVQVLLDLSGLFEEGVTAYQSKDCAVLEHESFEYLVGRSAFDFPDLDRFIWSPARDQSGIFKVDQKELLRALDVADVTLDQDRVALRWEGQRLSVVGSGNRGVGQMSVDAENPVDLDGHEVHCSASGLRQMLESVFAASGRLLFRVQGVGQVDRDDPGLVHVTASSAERVSQAAIRTMVIL